MSSRWFRHYAGMMRDEKLVRAAVKSKQPVERVIWVWGAILESAAEINDGGRYEFDTGEAAYFLRCDEADLASILSSLDSFGRLSKGVVARWGDRQYSSDAAAERQRRYRERKAGNGPRRSDGDHNGDAERDVTTTLRDGAVTAQETELETEKKEPIAQQPIAEPRKEPMLLDKLFEAAGIAGFREERHPGLLRLGPALSWLDRGYDLERDILPVIRDRARNKTFRSWDYFTDAIVDAATAKTAIPQRPAEAVVDWNSRLNAWREDGTWGAWGPKPGDPGCRVPPELLRGIAA